MVTPIATKRALDRMTGPEIAKDMERFVLTRVFPWVGGRAVYLAQHALGNEAAAGSHIRKVHGISEAVRKTESRRRSDGALLDTGDLKRSIAWWIDGKTLRVGIKDAHRRAVAYWHETGYSIRITKRMIGFFRFMAKETLARAKTQAERQDLAGRAKFERASDAWYRLFLNAAEAGEGARWDVPKRPFLTPAIERAWGELQTKMEGRVAEGLIAAAIGQHVGLASGGPSIETSVETGSVGSTVGG